MAEAGPVGEGNGVGFAMNANPKETNFLVDPTGSYGSVESCVAGEIEGGLLQDVPCM